MKYTMHILFLMIGFVFGNIMAEGVHFSFENRTTDHVSLDVTFRGISGTKSRTVELEPKQSKTVKDVLIWSKLSHLRN